MKVVQVCPYDMGRSGGVQAHVRDLSEWLERQGHGVRIVAPPAPGDRAGTSGRLVRLGRSRSVKIHGTGFEISLAAPWAVRRLATELRDWGAELLHLHTPWSPFLPGQIWRALPLPSVVTLHATLPRADGRGPVDRYIRRAARSIMARADRVVVPSEAPLPMLRQLADGQALRVLPPSVDLSPWRAIGSGEPDGRTVQLLFLGRLEPRKGVDVLLTAWREAAREVPEARLTVAGDGPLQEAVASAARDPALRLTYSGRPDDEGARRLMAAADLFVAPAPFGESFGIVLAEAMAAGTVPLAAANAGYSSVMTGEGTALLVPPGDPVALARRIVDLVRDGAARTRFRAWARARSECFDLSVTGPDYVALYWEVLARHS